MGNDLTITAGGTTGGGGDLVIKVGPPTSGGSITFTSNKLEDRRCRMEVSIRATFMRKRSPIDVTFIEVGEKFFMLTDRTLTGVEEVYIKQIMEVYNVEMEYEKRFLPILVNTN